MFDDTPNKSVTDQAQAPASAAANPPATPSSPSVEQMLKTGVNPITGEKLTLWYRLFVFQTAKACREIADFVE
jgi:hypothetical protein